MTTSTADSSSRIASLGRRLRTALQRSRIASAARRTRRYAANSRLAETPRYVRNSWIYGWLTAEPDPDVVVIDLRETVLVGPVIRLLDRVVERLAEAVGSSRVADLGRHVGGRVRARPVRLLATAVLSATVLSLLVFALTSRLTAPALVVHTLFLLLAVVGTRSKVTLEDARDTRAWSTLAAAFEPPEPPQRADTPEDDRTGKDEAKADDAGHDGVHRDREE